MTRSALEKILPKKSESIGPMGDDQRDMLVRNQAIDDCLDALVKAEIGVVPSEQKMYEEVNLIVYGQYYDKEDFSRKIATAIRSLMVNGEG